MNMNFCNNCHQFSPCQLSKSLGACHVTNGCVDFEFLHKIFFLTKSYRVLAANIKSLIISALVTMETWQKVPDLACFDNLWHLTIFGIFGLFDLAQAFI